MLVAIISSGSSWCQGQDEMPFAEVMKKVVRERQQPLTFELNFRIREFSYRNSSRDGREKGAIIETTGLIRFDELNESLYFEQTHCLKDVLNDQDRKSTEEFFHSQYRNRCVLITPVLNCTYSPDSDKFSIEARSAIKGDLIGEMPFYFKNFCLALPGELGSKRSFEETVKQLVDQYKSLNFSIDDQGIATLDLRNEFLKIDTKHGYWPIERIALAPDIVKGVKVTKPIEQQRMVLGKFHEYWLPKRFEMSMPQLSLGYDFDWQSYDTPLSKEAFDVEHLKNDRWKKLRKEFQGRK